MVECQLRKNVLATTTTCEFFFLPAMPPKVYCLRYRTFGPVTRRKRKWCLGYARGAGAITGVHKRIDRYIYVLLLRIRANSTEKIKAMMMLANVKMAVSTHSICLTSKLEHLQFGALFSFTLQAQCVALLVIYCLLLCCGNSDLTTYYLCVLWSIAPINSY